MAELQRLRRQILAWQLARRPGIALVERDLTRLYTQGRKRHQRVLRSKGDQTIALHQWRKRVKDLRYAAEILQRRDTPKRSRAQQHLRELARRADVLGELLGQDHDLAVLAHHLRSSKKRPHSRDDRPQGPRTWRIKPKTRKLLLKAIAKRQRELQKRALRDGARLYRHSPRKFLSRIS
jgi:CHAD domain-containing protein